MYGIQVLRYIGLKFIRKTFHCVQCVFFQCLMLYMHLHMRLLQCLQCIPVHSFVYLKFFVPLENFTLIYRRYPCRWRTANINLCPALMATEQWGIFSVPPIGSPRLLPLHARKKTRNKPYEKCSIWAVWWKIWNNVTQYKSK